MARWRGLVVVAGFVPDDGDLARDALSRIGADVEERHPAIAPFCAELVASFPDASFDEGGPGSVFGVGPRHVGLVIVSGDVKAVALGVIRAALRDGLVVFDLDTDQIHRPGGFGGITLKVEDRHLVVGPRWLDVVGAVADLTPAGGPSFMIVDRGDDDYAQIAGCDGHFTFERREPAPGGFRHWVAGYPGEAVHGTISVMTNGYHVPVRSNENISAADVERLFADYLGGEGRSPDFTWRDTTSMFMRAPEAEDDGNGTSV